MIYDRSFFREHAKSTYCFYRSQLNENQKSTYNIIREGLYDLSASIRVKNTSIKEIESIYQAIRLDNPSLFYVESISYQQMALLPFGDVHPAYRFQGVQIDATLNACVTKINRLLAQANGKSNLTKELVVHHFFSNNVKYDYDFMTSSYECVGPLLFGKGVCEGISKAAKLIFDLCGINSLVVHGNALSSRISNSDTGHAWNIVSLSSVFYHLDITFDLTIMSHGIERFDYLNLSDCEMKKDHAWDVQIAPTCNLSGDYYKQHGMYFQTQADFRQYLKKNILSASSDIVFRLPATANAEAASQEIIYVLQHTPAIKFKNKREFQICYNELQRVFHIHYL